MHARSIAAEVLIRVRRDGAFAAAALDSAIERHPALDPRDRALATEIVYGVLRWRGILEPALARHAPRGIDRLDANVRTHLEVAAYQLLRLDRVPAAAAVSAAVEAVKEARGARMGAFANALLRALARDPSGLPGPEERAALAMPRWLLDALSRSIGADEARAFSLRSLEPLPVWVRTNVARIGPADLARRIESERPGCRVAPHPLVAGALRVDGGGDLAALPAHREGLFTVQDAAAQAAAALVEPRPGERVLDACAGRGGKTGALVERAGGEIEVDAADDQPRKLERIEREMARLGHGGVRTAAVDLTVGSAGLRPPYDAVLVDAPCSGTGVIVRRPEVRWRCEPADVRRLAELQRALLHGAASLVRHGEGLTAGGRLVYSVCSLLDEEGPRVVADLTAGEKAWTLREEKRFAPHRDETDGFYVALIERSG